MDVMDAEPLAYGTVIDGRYRLVGTLGRGGFGIVYDAVQLSTGQRVALKVLDPSRLAEGGAASAKAIARFEREMKVVARLRHPHIVRLVDAGTDGAPYVVFELVEGPTLATLIDREGALEPSVARRLMLQVLEALACAHRAGVVHRDLKPGNIMVPCIGAHRHATVLDFGIAGLFGAATPLDQPALTSTGAILGTVAYMAPERFEAGPPRAESDLYAWGLVLLECLIGRAYHDGRSAGELVRMHCDPAPLPLPLGLDPEITRIIRRATAKSLADRYATAEEARAELEAWDPTSTPGNAFATTASEPMAIPTAGAPDGRPRRRPLLAGLALLGGAGVVGGVIAAVTAGPGGPPSPAAPIHAITLATADDAGPTQHDASSAAALADPDDTPPTGVVALAAARASTCALLRNGGVRCWGANHDGELGIGAELHADTASPVALAIADATAIAGAGDYWGATFCVLGKAHDVRCWGSNQGTGIIESRGAVAQPRPIRSSAVSAALAVTDLTIAGGGSACVVADGTPRCWGQAANGSLGVGTEMPAYESAPVALPAGRDRWDAQRVTCGVRHCCALDRAGGLACWGANFGGQVRPAPDKTFLAPVVVTTPVPLALLALEERGSCAVGRDARVYCWGERYGEGSAPAWFAGLEGVQAIASGPHHSCAVSKGHVFCWGSNTRGQLGDGTTRDTRTTVTEVVGLDGARGLGLGPEHSCAVLASGDVACWGSNARGQLGDGTLVDRLTPVRVVQVAAPTLPPATNGFESAPEAAPTSEPTALPPPECTPRGKLAADLGTTGLLTDPAGIPVTSAYARPLTTSRFDVSLADYRLAPDVAAPRGNPRGPQLRVELVLERREAQEGPHGLVREPFDRGRYAGGDKLRSASLRILSRRGESELFSAPDMLVVEVTALTADWICGTISARRGTLHLDGPFAARIVGLAGRP